MADINAVSPYVYSYNNQWQPKLDKNDDAAWDKSELQNYADAYKKATGTTLDVDKIMEKYANGDGVIDPKAQQQMRADDALGLSKLTGASSSASSSSTSGTGSTSSSSSTSNQATMALDKKFAIYDAVNAFTYEYSGTLKPRLDKNDDGMWSKDELTNYANAYNKATGNTLDVDALMTKYGNDDGFIDPKNQAQMQKDNALGLTALKSAYDSARATQTTVIGNKPQDWVSYGTKPKTDTATSGGYSIQDILANMSSSGKSAYSIGINRLDNMSSMLSAFNMSSGATNNMFSSILSDMTSLSQYKTSAAYSAMSGQAMNFTL